MNGAAETCGPSSRCGPDTRTRSDSVVLDQRDPLACCPKTGPTFEHHPAHSAFDAVKQSRPWLFSLPNASLVQPCVEEEMPRYGPVPQDQPPSPNVASIAADALLPCVTGLSTLNPYLPRLEQSGQALALWFTKGAMRDSIEAPEEWYPGFSLPSARQYAAFDRTESDNRYHQVRVFAFRAGISRWTRFPLPYEHLVDYVARRRNVEIIISGHYSQLTAGE